MPNLTGNLKGTATVRTIISLSDTHGHKLLLTMGNSKQTSSDSAFNNAKQTSWGTADLVQGHGQEHGYFMNEHASGDRACGTYECKISTVNGHVTMEGKWKYTHGTGQFDGITGNGTFKSHPTAHGEAETTFEGSYQLKAGTRAA